MSSDDLGWIGSALAPDAAATLAGITEATGRKPDTTLREPPEWKRHRRVARGSLVRLDPVVVRRID
jgi:hypothetical protein